MDETNAAPPIIDLYLAILTLPSSSVCNFILAKSNCCNVLGKVGNNAGNAAAAKVAAILAKSIPLIVNFKRSKNVIATVNDTVIIVKVLTILFKVQKKPQIRGFKDLCLPCRTKIHWYMGLFGVFDFAVCTFKAVYVFAYCFK